MQFQKIVDLQVQWLKDYASKAKTKGFVVGVSGGIDSALTSKLCALTGLPTLLVEMPIHQADDQVNRGQEHITQLLSIHPNCTSNRTNLTDTYDQFLEELGKNSNLNISEELRNLTLGNTRARLRMTTLYAIAGLNNALVVGTGNKVEDFGVGFYTKYGDGGVDISPIADLYKTEVFELSEFLGISKSILIAPPTDGLWDDGRTDEDQIGASYAELEEAMKVQELYGNDPSKDKFSSVRSQKVWDIYITRWRANQHKMNPIPVCLIPSELKTL